MTLSDVPIMLLGAALVASGVLASALADRIRGNRAQREATLALLDESEKLPSARARKVSRPTAPSPVPVWVSAPVVETQYVPDDPGKTVRPRGSASGTPNGVPVAKVVVNAQMAADVIAALVNAGYHKNAATNAVMACVPTEQTSVSNWTLAALRRCARGEVVS